MQIFIKISVISAFFALASFLVFIDINNSTSVFAKVETDYKKIFLQNCARCHGADGKSQTELGKKFDSPNLTRKKTKKRSNEKLFKKIAEGDGDMPAFGKRLSKEDINGLIEFVRSL